MEEMIHVVWISWYEEGDRENNKNLHAFSSKTEAEEFLQREQRAIPARQKRTQALALLLSAWEGEHPTAQPHYVEKREELLRYLGLDECHITPSHVAAWQLGISSVPLRRAEASQIVPA